jgi:hypothetical protein
VLGSWLFCDYNMVLTLLLIPGSLYVGRRILFCAAEDSVQWGVWRVLNPTATCFDKFRHVDVWHNKDVWAWAKIT